MIVVFLALIATADAPTPAANDVAHFLILGDGQLIRARLEASLDGGSVRKARQDYLDRLIRSLDVDGDGALIRRETIHCPFLSGNGRARGNSGLFDVYRNRQVVPASEIVETIDQIAGPPIAIFENRQHYDFDREIFNRFDADSSGSLDAAEISNVGDALSKKDLDGDGCVVRGEFAYEGALPIRGAPFANDGLPRHLGGSRVTTAGARILDADAPKFGERLIAFFDNDGDHALAPGEMGLESLGAGDANGDGKLTLDEAPAFARASADVVIVARLGAKPTDAPPLTIHAPGDAEIPDGQPFSLRGATLRVTFVESPPPSEAKQGADLAFAEADADANGYVDEKEGNQPQGRFANGLFTAIDANGDGKIFPDELDYYVTGRSEPVATSCRMTIKFTGHGWFETLDGDGDGAISLRERRRTADVLAKRLRAGEAKLTYEELAECMEIEIARGSFQPFPRPRNRSANVANNAASKNEPRRPGPVWSQRMDRNGDGDVSWDEFLGPRAAFDRLDRDRDGLIDAREADQP